MEFKNIICPVCGVPFDGNNDVVVCPECGTPHHRQCYERLGHCVNKNKHGTDFSWKESQEETPFVVCPQCGTKNPKESIFCSSCANPLINDKNSENKHQTQPFGPTPESRGIPFGGFHDFGSDAVYKNTGISKEEEIAPNVTAQDCERFVKNSFFYYLTVFKNIKILGKSRFNFSAAIFNGIWFLYRKMYFTGTILAILNIILIFIQLFFTNGSEEIYKRISGELVNGNVSSLAVINHAISSLSTSEFIIFIAPSLANFMSLAICIISGIIGNRTYYKNMTKIVGNIKSKNPSKMDLNKELNLAGGTSMIGPIIVFGCSLAISIISKLI